MNEQDGFTSAVRLELASLPVPSEREARAELAGMLMVGDGPARTGRLGRDFADLRPGDLPLAPLCEPEALRLDAPSSAVARRGMALIQRTLGLRPRLTAVSTTARRPHGPAYRVSVPASAVRAREAGRGPRAATATGVDADGLDTETAALLRGAVLVGGSFSAPDRAVHVELSGVPDGLAPLLIAALDQLVPGSRPLHDPARRRLVLKSGAVVTDLLAALGATRAFLMFDDRRLRRQLRGEANRLANADAANLARIARSAGAQVDAIEQAVARAGWDRIPSDLHEVALARLANPSASISELAQLLDTPRATLHRRLARLEAAALDLLEGPSPRAPEGGSDSVPDEPLPPRSTVQEDP